MIQILFTVLAGIIGVTMTLYAIIYLSYVKHGEKYQAVIVDFKNVIKRDSHNNPVSTKVPVFEYEDNGEKLTFQSSSTTLKKLGDKVTLYKTPDGKVTIEFKTLLIILLFGIAAIIICILGAFKVIQF